MPRILENLVGRTFGQWTVITRAPSVPTIKETIWSCRCSCGVEANIPKSNLTRGLSTKCTVCRARELTAIAAARPKKAKVVKPKRVGAAHHRWKGDAVSYGAAHTRIKRRRGAAGTHKCVDCNSAAKDWSRDAVECEAVLTDDQGRAYCTHIEHYSPRCRDCHNRLDH